MRSTATITAGLLCVMAVALPGLLQHGCDTASQGNGTLKMLVTDKPFPFEFIEEATVTITRVEVRQTQPDAGDDQEEVSEDSNGGTGEVVNGEAERDIEGDDESDANDLDGDESPFLVVFEGQETFNLLDLQNGVTASLVDTTLPAGPYSQVRLIIFSGTIRLSDGREFDLNVPSGAQTGIKLHFNFEIEAQQETVLLMDVDLSKAFVPVPGGQINEASDIQMFHFKPSHALRLTTVVETGSISGIVTDLDDNPLENVAVTAYMNGLEISSTSTTEEGLYVLSALEAELYWIEFSLGEFEEGKLSDIEVNAGEETGGMDITLTAENGEPNT